MNLNLFPNVGLTRKPVRENVEQPMRPPLTNTLLSNKISIFFQTTPDCAPGHKAICKTTLTNNNVE